MTIFKNGNSENYSFSRIAAFITILGSQVLASFATIKAINISGESIDWVGLGSYVKNLFGGTSIMVLALYGSNKAAEALSKFAEAKKGVAKKGVATGG